MANVSNIARGVDEGWLHQNVVRASERRASGATKVRDRDVVLSTDADMPPAAAIAMLADEGVTVADLREDGWCRDGGHQNGCRADHRVRTCGAAAHWPEPATIGAEREDGTRAFRCDGCGSWSLFDIPDAGQKTGRKVMAHRAHIIAKEVLRNGGAGRNVWHPSVAVWRCPTCHAGHGDGTVILPATPR